MSAPLRPSSDELYSASTTRDDITQLPCFDPLAREMFQYEAGFLLSNHQNHTTRS